MPEARKRWIEFHDHVESNLAEEGGGLWAVRGFANKLPEHAARLAAVLTLIEDIDALAIGEANMKRGVELAEHYVSEALRLFEAGQVKAELMLAQRLRDWLWQWPEDAISLPDIYQRGLNAIGDQATARRMVGILADHGWLAPIDGGAVIAGQRRREAWMIVRA